MTADELRASILAAARGALAQHGFDGHAPGTLDQIVITVHLGQENNDVVYAAFVQTRTKTEFRARRNQRRER